MTWTTRAILLVLILAALIPASRLGPSPTLRGHARGGTGERALKVAIEPLRGLLIPFYWLASAGAMSRQDTPRALEYGRRLLALMPEDPAPHRDLMNYLSQGAVRPFLAETPPRVDHAYLHIEQALEIGREAVERHGLEECWEILAGILLYMELDYLGEYGLKQRYIEIHGESPGETYQQLAKRHGTPGK